MSENKSSDDPEVVRGIAELLYNMTPHNERICLSAGLMPPRVGAFIRDAIMIFLNQKNQATSCPLQDSEINHMADKGVALIVKEFLSLDAEKGKT